MRKGVKTKVKLIGALELERQLKHQLESSNYSLILNFDFFQQLILKQNKHHGDLDHLKKFIKHIPYLNKITSLMPNRMTEKFITKLGIRTYQPTETTQNDFQIILRGEIQIQDRNLVKSDTFFEIGIVVQETVVLTLSQENYQNMIEEYHETLLNLKLETIKNFSVFHNISQNRLRNQLDQFKEESYSINTILYKEGNPLSHIYLILEGEIKLMKDSIELQLSSSKSIVGEWEMILQSDFRIHRAYATQATKVYKISILQLRYILQMSNLYDQLVHQFKAKEKFWKDRQHQLKKEQTIQIDYQEFKQPIPKHYQNYISVTKLKGRQQQEDIDQQLREARKGKFDEAFKQFQEQIKFNFKTNYPLRKVLIQAKQTKHDLPIMEGLNLNQYVPQYSFQHNKTRSLLKRFASEEYFNFESRTTTITKPTRLVSANSRLFSGQATPHQRTNRPQTGVLIKGKRSVRIQSNLDFE